MAVKVWIDGDVLYVDNGVATANPINLNTFFFEKDDNSNTVTLRDSNDGFKVRAPFGDIQDEFGTPIGTYIQVVDFLESIVTQGTIVPLPANAATESTLLDVLAAVDAMRDYEVRLVVDSIDVTWLEVRYWDAQDGTLGAPVYYPPGSTTPGAPTGAVTYINPNTFLAQIVTNTTGLNLEVTQLLIKVVLDSISTSITDGTGTDNTAHGVSQKGSRILGTDGANDQQIKVDTDGNVAVNVLTSALPSGAATEATLALIDAVMDAIKLDTANLDVLLSTRAAEATQLLGNAILATIDADTSNMVGILTAIDSVLDAIKLDTANLDVTLSSRLNTLGQKASADSAPVALSTEQEVILDAIKTAVEGTPASTLIAFGGQLRLIGNTGFTFLGCTSVSVINVGNADGSMTAGFFGTIKPGEEQSWEAPAGSHLPSITFDATTLGAELVITFVQP